VREDIQPNERSAARTERPNPKMSFSHTAPSRAFNPPSAGQNELSKFQKEQKKYHVLELGGKKQSGINGMDAIAMIQ
jgi:hypothetical protein